MMGLKMIHANKRGDAVPSIMTEGFFFQKKQLMLLSAGLHQS